MTAPDESPRPGLGRARSWPRTGAGRPLALLFDYDGTLTPIVRHPSLARLSAANRDRLARLTALPA